MGFKNNIEKLTLHNNFYRKVIYTTKQMQLVLMNIPENQEIGEEVHKHNSQFIRIEGGSGTATVGTKKYRLKDGDAIIIPSGIKHNIRASDKGLKLYTIYSPPEHPENLKEK